LGQVEASLGAGSSMDSVQQQMVCAAVNTCKYCHETTGQLEESIVKVDKAYLLIYIMCVCIYRKMYIHTYMYVCIYVYRVYIV